MDAGRHPNIQVLTCSHVTKVDGEAGNFQVTIRREPRYVSEELCNGCGQCAEVCPSIVPNEFELGLGARKAIYTPFSQAVPNTYVLDRKNCLNKDQFIVCENCRKVCDTKAINYDMEAEDMTVNVGSIVVATGFEPFDPYDMKTYGYGISPNIVTGLEFERMLNASGPTFGHVVKLTDKKPPRRLAFVQCVGVRGENGCHYCSRFCCMNSIKDAMLAKDHSPEIEEITIFYSDIRAFGKGYDDFYLRSQQCDYINFIRGKPSKIIEKHETDELEVFVEDTTIGRPLRLKMDMVILSSAARPNADAQELATILGIECDRYGFYKSLHPDTDSLKSSREGVFLAGCAKGPDDIPDVVAQASGAAAEAQKFVVHSRIEEKPKEIAQLDTDGEPRIGVFLCHCGINIAGVLDIESMANTAKELPDVVHVEDDLFLCSDSGQKKIQQIVIEKKLNRVVAAACTPRTHEPVFRETLELIGLNPFLFEMVNVRDQCSWVHAKEPENALLRAQDQLKMGISRATWLEPLTPTSIDIEQSALVIGGGIAGMKAALTLDAQGFKTYLIEKEDVLGGRLNDLWQLAPEGLSAKKAVEQLERKLESSNVSVYLRTKVLSVGGFVGNFSVETFSGTFKVGVIIVAVGSGVYQPANNEYGYGVYDRVITSLELEKILLRTRGKVLFDGAIPKRAVFIQCVGSRNHDRHTGCSRYCCLTTIRHAIALRKQGSEAVVLYRDMRTFSHGAEELYRKAREMGVMFIRFDEDTPPQVVGNGELKAVKVYDKLLKDDIHISADLLVLAVGMSPDQAMMHQLKEMLKIPTSLDGSFMERHPKLGPVETTSEGIYICGSAQGPKDVADTLAQAAATAGRAGTFLSHKSVKLDPSVSVVEPQLCRGCGTCQTICLFNAPQLIETEPGVFIAEINKALCKGCGTCAAWCPTEAIVAKHFTDQQIYSMIETFLLEGAT